MSASLLVDLRDTCQMTPSIVPQVIDVRQSGGVIGNTVDMLYADTMTQLFVAGALQNSGQLRVQVQTAASDVSGSFTDPTSGLPQLPTGFSSGGILFINSGGAGLYSGFYDGAAFQRPGRYVRANVIGSGTTPDFFVGSMTAGFVAQLRTTGSGGGYSPLPSSGAINV